mgnify:CR=1 FL=1
MLYIGVDLGTSAVKLLVMDEYSFESTYQKNIRYISHIRDGQSRNRKTGLKNQWKGLKN